MEMKSKAYAYLRVSTFTQVDGKSLEGQLEEIKQYCKVYNIELVGVYSDEGKSGKLDYEAIKGLLEKFNEICATVPKELKKKLLQSLVKEVKLGYNEKGKVIPVSMTIKFTGEQIELMSEAPKNFGLNVGTAETVVLMSKVNPKK